MKLQISALMWSKQGDVGPEGLIFTAAKIRLMLNLCWWLEMK